MARIMGTVDQDFLVGTPNADVIDGLAGSDFIDALEGDDLLNGGPGDDFLVGGYGNDRLFGGAGNDFFDQVGYSNDRIDGGPGIDFVNFATVSVDPPIDPPITVDLAVGTFIVEGVLTRLIDIEGVSAGTGNDLLIGDSKDNLLVGIEGQDTILGGGGDDTVDGGAGDDLLRGGAGNDTILTRTGTDMVWGDAGDDVLSLSSGANAWGGSGADQFGVSANVTIEDFKLGSGDVIDLQGQISPGQSMTFIGQAPFADSNHQEVRYERRAGDTFVQFENSQGAVSEVQLKGKLDLTANDFLLGLTATAGNDTIVGTQYADSASGLAGDDKIFGRGGNDRLDGRQGNDLLDGGCGNDVLFGDEGNDTYIGSPGDDQMADFFTAGATGDDTYIFSGQFGHDFINDFSPGQDKLVFPGLNASDVTVSRGGTNLEVTVKGTGDYVAMITDHDVQLVFGGNVTM